MQCRYSDCRHSDCMMFPVFIQNEVYAGFCEAVASSIIGGGGGGGGLIFIYSCTHTIKNNQFQKKLIVQNTNI